MDEIKKEIIAFANCDVGKLYMGVRDDGTVVGVDDRTVYLCKSAIWYGMPIKSDVTMFVHYKAIEENGKEIVAVDIQRGTDRLTILQKGGQTRRYLRNAGNLAGRCCAR